MNIIILCLTILAGYGIILYAYKAYLRADKEENTEDAQEKIHERMEEIKETEENYAEVVQFKKTHKGNIEKKEKTINEFTTKE